MKRVVIVGAGVSGLATAYHIRRLARERGVELRVTILEGSARPGGRVWTERVEGFQIEMGANGFLDSKRSTLDLCNELGLTSELIAARPEAKDRFIFWRDRLHKLPTGPGELWGSGLLSWRGKLRLLGEAFVPRRRDEVDESVHEFACRRLGREAAEVLVDAMVTGIKAGDATLLSVAAAFPRMVELERDYGSLIRAMPKVRRKRLAEAAALPHHSPLTTHHSPPTAHHSPPTAHHPPLTTHHPPSSTSPGGTLWSLHGGMGQLIETLTAACGAELIRGVAARRIARRQPSGWTVFGDGVDRWDADSLVLACPSFVQAELAEPIDSELARLLSEIRYNSVSVVALGFRTADLSRPLDGFGYLVPQRLRRDVLGVLWNSTIFTHRAPVGMVLLQAMCGGWNRPEIVNWDDERLVRAVLDELRHAIQITCAPALVRIIRWPQAIPQYHVGHLARVGAIESQRRQYPGLFLTGNSFRGVSVNDCTEEAVRCALEIEQNLHGISKQASVP